MSGSPRLVRATSAPKSPCHCDYTVYFTAQPAAAAPAGSATAIPADASRTAPADSRAVGVLRSFGTAQPTRHTGVPVGPAPEPWKPNSVEAPAPTWPL